MKKVFSFLLIVIAGIPQIMACNICGCSGGMGSGIFLPSFNSKLIQINSFFGMYHRRSEPSLLSEGLNGKIHQYALSISGRYDLTDRLYLEGKLSNTLIIEDINNKNKTYSKLAIPAFGFRYRLVNTANEADRKYNHLFDITAELNTPFGMEKKNEFNTKGIEVAPIFNSYNLDLGFEYNLSRSSYGLMARFSTNLTAATKEIKPGNALYAAILPYYTFNVSPFNVNMFAGLDYQFRNKSNSKQN